MKKQLDAAASLLKQCLTQLKVDDLPISNYSRKYFYRYQSTGFSIFDRLTDIVSRGFERRRNQSEPSSIDYGGGLGLISLLIKAAGLGYVDYIDIARESAQDARTIASALKLPADHYHVGELYQVQNELIGRSLRPDMIFSSEVIEHIFDIEAFFDAVAFVIPDGGSVVFSTSANPLNPFVAFNLRRIQRRYEAPAEVFAESYVALRQAYIRNKLNDRRIDASVVLALAARTRGLVFEDIDEILTQFGTTGILPKELADPTNTCDPRNGCWCERLMNPHLLSSSLARRGFGIDVSAGQYVLTGGPFKNWTKLALNKLMVCFGSNALYFAPTYILSGTRLSRNSADIAKICVHGNMASMGHL